MPFENIKLRFAVSGLIIAAYVLSLAPFALLGWEAMFMVAIVGLFGLPMLGLAIVVGWLCAAQIVAEPWKWSLSAGLGALLITSIGMGFLTGGTLAGFIGLPIALLAPAIFVGLLKALTPWAPPADS